MPRTRQELEALERQSLAPYAQFSADTRGRKHREPPPEWRTEYQRDRDRVIHSRAFRRLEYKTQVFLNGTGDHLRTRLTHTMEVAAHRRNIARALKLNEDLAETIALAHDLGHSPFGHKGETVFNRLMKESRRLRAQSPEPAHRRGTGAEISAVLRPESDVGGARGSGSSTAPVRFRPGKRAGVSRRDRPRSKPRWPTSRTKSPTTATTSTTVWIRACCPRSSLSATCASGARPTRTVEREYGKLADECRRYFIIRCITDLQVKDVVTTTEKLIGKAGVASADDVRRQPRPLVQYSPDRRALNLELRAFLYKNLYYNPAVSGPHRRSRRILEELFQGYLQHHEQVGGLARKRARRDGWPRAICDYLAGMTDRYAILEHQTSCSAGLAS